MAKISVFRNEAGKRVPSVTAIAGQLDKPGIVHWAHKLGLEGIENLYGHRDSLKQAGNLMHEIIEMCLSGPDSKAKPVHFSKIDIDEIYRRVNKLAYTEEEIALSRPIFERACNLLASISPMATMMMEHSLVSERHQFGGRLDWYGVTSAPEDSLITLLDIKTGKDVYAETIIQLAAYRGLLLERGFALDKVIVARIGPTPGEGEEIRTLTDKELSAAWDTFLHLRAVYDLQKIIKPDTRKKAA
ncbi:MAG: hypothetical protein LBK91_07580 [Synergistaceae bacterium]|jgi:hypothetical protein|nr:hypothetical protein [Synergistaceae bacterium]